MYRIMIILLTFVVIAGCGAVEMNGSGEGNSSGPSGPSVGDPSEENREPKAVELETALEVKKENNNLIFEITLTNRSGETVELPFSSGQQFEVVVINGENEEVYRYSEGRMFTQALTFIEIKAGEKLSWIEEWDQKSDHTWVSNGEYKVTAEVLVQDSEGNIVINQGDLIAEKKVTVDNEFENNAFRQIKVVGENGEYIITGEARVYEAVFHYAVTEGHFYYIEEWMTVDEGGPSWSPFTIEISIAEDDLPVNGTVSLELFEESAKDSSRVNRLNVPLETFNP
jgi:hypothetical protein